MSWLPTSLKPECRSEIPSPVASIIATPAVAIDGIRHSKDSSSSLELDVKFLDHTSLAIGSSATTATDE